MCNKKLSMVCSTTVLLFENIHMHLTVVPRAINPKPASWVFDDCAPPLYICMLGDGLVRPFSLASMWLLFRLNGPLLHSIDGSEEDGIAYAFYPWSHVCISRHCQFWRTMNHLWMYRRTYSSPVNWSIQVLDDIRLKLLSTIGSK